MIIKIYCDWDLVLVTTGVGLGAAQIQRAASFKGAIKNRCSRVPRAAIAPTRVKAITSPKSVAWIAECIR